MSKSFCKEISHPEDPHVRNFEQFQLSEVEHNRGVRSFVYIGTSTHRKRVVNFQAGILQHPRKQIPLFFVREKQTENCGTLYTEGTPDETRATFALTPSTRAPRQLNPVYQF
ncbi:hypothetical protein ANTRET_LOCUS8493 [Anthophora retusa]